MIIVRKVDPQRSFALRLHTLCIILFIAGLEAALTDRAVAVIEKLSQRLICHRDKISVMLYIKHVQKGTVHIAHLIVQFLHVAALTIFLHMRVQNDGSGKRLILFQIIRVVLRQKHQLFLHIAAVLIRNGPDMGKSGNPDRRNRDHRDRPDDDIIHLLFKIPAPVPLLPKYHTALLPVFPRSSSTIPEKCPPLRTSCFSP